MLLAGAQDYKIRALGNRGESKIEYAASGEDRRFMPGLETVLELLAACVRSERCFMNRVYYAADSQVLSGVITHRSRDRERWRRGSHAQRRS